MKDFVLEKVWYFYRGRGRRRRSPGAIALMILGTTVLVAGLLVTIAALISGRPTTHVGDDPNTVPTSSN